VTRNGKATAYSSTAAAGEFGARRALGSASGARSTERLSLKGRRWIVLHALSLVCPHCDASGFGAR
jgi:hypothetical protein